MTHQPARQTSSVVACVSTILSANCAAEALAHLDQAWAYYTPEPRLSQLSPDAVTSTEGAVDYYAAA
ncbi:hypothetical protein PhaeoP97_02976 [Phaeobacter porticola]|uniref:Uncharacterized protein n=1 Tax=Phaeobacter porticola TaxID=1844006 RepID=A0A1L3I8F7_9RHOB|nr:hypothetical protein PhaeoP97_02976 [Phaeobacter porticola]